MIGLFRKKELPAPKAEYELVTDGSLWAIKRTRDGAIYCNAYGGFASSRTFESSWFPRERAEQLFKRITA